MKQLQSHRSITPDKRDEELLSIPVEGRLSCEEQRACNNELMDLSARAPHPISTLWALLPARPALGSPLQSSTAQGDPPPASGAEPGACLCTVLKFFPLPGPKCQVFRLPCEIC